MMRDQILGMEVVLADGTILSSMNKTLKNNTGYDLKRLFIGYEGTLGVVTKLVLRIRSLPVSQKMALLGVNDFSKVTEFLNHIDSARGGTLSAFGLLWQDYYALATKPPAEGRPLLAHDYKYYILLEALGGSITADQERFVLALSEALEQELIVEAVIDQNQDEREAMWAIRDHVGQVGQNSPISTFDISVSLNQMESYLEERQLSLTKQWPEHTCMIFGHLGDGNLHIIVANGVASPKSKKAIFETVYAGLPARGVSVSAELDIGLQKKNTLVCRGAVTKLA
ncbi:MAG: FAD/FMN-containing dehydrogenase [Candidatus Azotimanducaceae bacterium]|jgi:FAD/FMN-containing dehydrogenase